MGEEAMTLTDEDKYWIEAAMEESSKRFEHQFTNLIQSVRRIDESHGSEHLPTTL
jgi:hypothetical protein